jgi:S1-C subfamily serine protease
VREMTPMTRKLLITTAVLFLGLGAARGDDLVGTARTVATKVAKANVRARLVVKISVGDREQDQKLEINGTVIDPSGLTVVSAAAVDPAASVRGAMGGRRGGGGAGEAPRIESDVTETALVLEDGTEVEAEVVLKDAELDLAFIRPKDATTKLEHVDLKQREAAPQLLDPVFVVSRMGRVANHSVSLTTGTIRSIVKGPRTFYICDAETSTNTSGSLVFAADGSPLGVLVTKSVRGEAGGMRARGDAAIIVRPVNDLIELATQAKTAKAPEKKKKDDEGAKKEPAKDEKKGAEKKKPDADKKDGDD